MKNIYFSIHLPTLSTRNQGLRQLSNTRENYRVAPSTQYEINLACFQASALRKPKPFLIPPASIPAWT